MRFPVPVVLVLLAVPAFADDKATAEKLKDAKVEVKFDKAGTAASVFCKESHGLTPEHYQLIASLGSIKELTLYNKCSLTDETLALLSGLEKLEKVGIDGAKFTDAGMKHMAGWKSLKTMTFFHSLNKDGFTGAGVAHLKGLANFTNFGCGGSSFTDAGMVAVAQLPHLTDLRLWHTQNTDAGTVHLKKLKLKSVWLAPQFTTRITDKSLSILAEIPTLEDVKITETRLTWDGGLKPLSTLPNLKKVNLDETDIAEADLEQFKAAVPKVKVERKPPDEKQLGWLKDRFDKAKK